jgi:hypothetical protein|tara:strand:- start:210 stop:584 length:375 start_codon:yes stop_codon:yes gene_type:complete
MEPYIDVTKLKRNSQLLIETVQTIYEITVTGPKSCSVSVHGGIRFVLSTKARFQGSISIISEEELIPNLIKRNHSLQFFYRDEKGEHSLVTSPVLSGKIISPDKSWKYDAIEREEKRDEDSNKA